MLKNSFPLAYSGLIVKHSPCAEHFSNIVVGMHGWTNDCITLKCGCLLVEGTVLGYYLVFRLLT